MTTTFRMASPSAFLDGTGFASQDELQPAENRSCHPKAVAVHVAGVGGDSWPRRRAAQQFGREFDTSVEGLQKNGNPVHKWLINDG